MRKQFTLLQRGLLTLLVLAVCRIFCSIPTPGVNVDYFELLIAQNASLGFFNTMAGNGLSNLSILTLSITPYITSTIIMQLLGVIFKRIQDLAQGMEDERKMYDRITFIVCIIVAVVQSIAIAAGFGKSGLLIDYKWYWIALITVVWTVSSTVLAYVGKKMSDRQDLFLGNGISLLLAMNILSSYPSDALTIWYLFFHDTSKKTMLKAGGVILVIAAVMLSLTIIIQEARKDIPIIFANKVKSNGTEKKQTELPIKLCPGSVIPIIFASSILTFPTLTVTFLGKSDMEILHYLDSGYWFQADKPIYSIGAVIYVVLIVVFSYFYLDITFNAAEVASKIRKNGGMVTGVRPGQQTADYLKKEMNRIVGIGALLLSVVALIPAVVGGIFSIVNISFLGTSILITSSVLMELKEMISIELKAEKYKKTGKKAGGLFEKNLFEN